MHIDQRLLWLKLSFARVHSVKSIKCASKLVMTRTDFLKAPHLYSMEPKVQENLLEIICKLV